MHIYELSGSADRAVNAALIASIGDLASTASGKVDLGSAIWSAIAQLETRSREVFLMVRFQRHTLEFTTTALGLPSAETERLFARATQEVNAQIRHAQRRAAVTQD